MARKKKSKKPKTTKKTKKTLPDQNQNIPEEKTGFLSDKERKSLEYLYMILFLGSIVFGLVYFVGLIMALI